MLKQIKKSFGITSLGSTQGKQIKHFTPTQNSKNISKTPFWRGENALRIIPLGGCEEVGRNMTV